MSTEPNSVEKHSVQVYEDIADTIARVLGFRSVLILLIEASGQQNQLVVKSFAAYHQSRALFGPWLVTAGEKLVGQKLIDNWIPINEDIRQHNQLIDILLRGESYRIIEKLQDIFAPGVPPAVAAQLQTMAGVKTHIALTVQGKNNVPIGIICAGSTEDQISDEQITRLGILSKIVVMAQENMALAKTQQISAHEVERLTSIVNNVDNMSNRLITLVKSTDSTIKGEIVKLVQLIATGSISTNDKKGRQIRSILSDYLRTDIATIYENYDLLESAITEATEEELGTLARALLPMLLRIHDSVSSTKQVAYELNTDLKQFRKAIESRANTATAADKQFFEANLTLKAAYQALSSTDGSDSARYAGITYHARSNQKNIIVIGKKDVMQDVFLTIFKNACEAMGETGELYVQTEARPTTEGSKSGTAIIKIHDTGPGIPLLARGKIFDSGISRRPVNTRGLNTAYTTIIGLGGTIECDSRTREESELTGQPQGTTFVITLPLAYGLL